MWFSWIIDIGFPTVARHTGQIDRAIRVHF